MLDWTWPQILEASRCLAEHYESILTAVFGKPKTSRSVADPETSRPARGTAREQAEGRVERTKSEEQMARAREAMSLYALGQARMPVRTTKG